MIEQAARADTRLRSLTGSLFIWTCTSSRQKSDAPIKGARAEIRTKSKELSSSPDAQRNQERQHEVADQKTEPSAIRPDKFSERTEHLQSANVGLGLSVCPG